MQNQPPPPSLLFRESRLHPLLIADVGLSSALLALPNTLLAVSFMKSIQTSDGKVGYSTWAALNALELTDCLLWVLANLCLLVALYALQRHLFTPMAGIIRQLYSLRVVFQEVAHPTSPALSMRTIAAEVGRIAQVAHEHYAKQQETAYALKQARGLISQISTQQSAIVSSTSREMMTQYQSVLAYANYLESQIACQSADPDLRYDFDEVSESSFNLKLIAGALNLVGSTDRTTVTRIDVPQLLQHTMLALAPSLDRRNMKLTTAQVDLGVTALSDPATIAHALWMMLLGTVRYAADESTLRLRCLYNRDKSRVLLSIVVSELSPGRLSEEERRTFLEHQLERLSPHLFADAIRIHGNIQLADMLVTPLDGTLSVLPLTSHSCEICLSLPTAPASPE